MAVPGQLPSQALVYEVLSEGLEPEFQRLEARRLQTVTYPAWRWQNTVFVSLQVDSKATDPYSGGGFRVELEKSDNKLPALGLNGRAMFFQLLTLADLQPLLERQNEVIRGLPRPPRKQVDLYPAGRVRDRYLAYFEPQASFGGVQSWLRFHSVEDVMCWAPLLSPLLGTLMSRAEALLRVDERSLGKGSLL